MRFDVPAILENCCFSVFIHMEYSFQGGNRSDLGCFWRTTEYPFNSLGKHRAVP